MSFKDMYLEDLETTFFDLEEFASEHMIDGKTMTVVLIESNAEEGSVEIGARRSNINPKETAVNKRSMTLYIQEKDAIRRFSVNARIRLDEKNLFVQKVSHYDGIYKLVVGTYSV